MDKDSEVAATSMKVSLLCPVSRSILSVMHVYVPTAVPNMYMYIMTVHVHVHCIYSTY